MIHPFVPWAQTKVSWHFRECGRDRILLNCHPKIKKKNQPASQERHKETKSLPWTDGQQAGAELEGEELPSSRGVPWCHHLPGRSSKLRARLARVLLPRDVVVCPPKCHTRGQGCRVQHSSPQGQGTPWPPPALTVQNNSKVPSIPQPSLPPEEQTPSKPSPNPTVPCEVLGEAVQGQWHLAQRPSGLPAPLEPGWGGTICPKTHPRRL